MNQATRGTAGSQPVSYAASHARSDRSSQRPRYGQAGPYLPAERPAKPSGTSNRNAAGRAAFGQHPPKSGSWFLIWTMISGLIPGTGLVAAGRKTWGLAILSFLGTLLVFAIGLVLFMDRTQLANLGASIALSSSRLFVSVGIATVAGVAIMAIIFISFQHLVNYARPANFERWLGMVLTLVLMAPAMATVAQLNYIAFKHSEAMGNIFQKGPGLGADPWRNLPRVNVLLLGSDAGDYRAGVRTDTMILASIDTQTGDALMIGIPRNLSHVPFPTGSPGAQVYPNGFYCPTYDTAGVKINDCMMSALWRYGDELDLKEAYAASPNPGLAALTDGVQGVTGLRPHFYMMINIEGFVDVVDALGGITVNVRKRLPIGGSTKNPVAVGGWIEPGENQLLNGYQAMWFARSRWSTSDYDRMARQRCTVAAIMNQVQPQTLATRFGGLADAAQANIQTNINEEDLDAWGELGIRILENKGIRSFTITSRNVGTGNTENPDYRVIRANLEQALNPPAPTVEADTGADAGTDTGAGTGTDAGVGTDTGAGPGTDAGTSAGGGEFDTQNPNLSLPGVDPNEASQVEEVC